MNDIDRIEITGQPLRADRATEFVTDPRAGGVDVFLGTTRAEKSSGGRELVALDYEAYDEMAMKQLQDLARRARAQWPIIKLAILHRVGRVVLGEPSVIIAVSTPHRADAFEACRFIIDQLKVDVAIWKKENWADGSVSWIHPSRGEERGGRGRAGEGETRREGCTVRQRIQSRRQLDVYKRAFVVAMRIFEISKAFPREETYSLTDQIRRSSRSACANTTEAWRKRRYEAAFVSRLSDAETEAAETETWLEFAVHCGYVERQRARELYKEYEQIISMLVHMITHPEMWLIPKR